MVCFHGAAPVWYGGVWVAELVKVGMRENLDGGGPLFGRVLEHGLEQLDGVGQRALEYAGEGVGAYLWEALLRAVMRVHGLDLVAGRRAQHFYDLDELINAVSTGEKWLAQHELGHDADAAPHVDLGSVVDGAEYEFWGAVVARADVRDVGFAPYQDLGAAEVAQLEDACSRVAQQVAGLDISVADAERVDVAEGAEKLVGEQLDDDVGHGLSCAGEPERFGVYRTGHVFKHEVEVDVFVLGGEEICMEADYVDVADVTHDFELSVFEATVLEHSLDGDLLSRGNYAGLEHETKGAIAYDLLLLVPQFHRLVIVASPHLLPHFRHGSRCCEVGGIGSKW